MTQKFDSVHEAARSYAKGQIDRKAALEAIIDLEWQNYLKRPSEYPYPWYSEELPTPEAWPGNEVVQAYVEGLISKVDYEEVYYVLSDAADNDEYGYDEYDDDRLSCGCCSCCGCFCEDYEFDDESEYDCCEEHG